VTSVTWDGQPVSWSVPFIWDDTAWTWDGSAWAWDTQDASWLGVSFIGATTNQNNNTTGTSLTVDKPQGAGEGHYAIASVKTRGENVTGPEGWTELHQMIDSNSNHGLWVKELGDSEPADYTWTQASDIGRMAIGISVYGNATLDGWEWHVTNTWGDDGELEIIAPDIIPTVEHCMVIRLWAGARTGLIAPQDPETLRYQSSPNTSTGRKNIAGADSVHPSTDPAGESIAVVENPGNALTAFTVALAPVPVEEEEFPAPTGLTATPISSSQIDLSWDEVVEAEFYDIERNEVVIVQGHGMTTYEDIGLDPNTEYIYRVRSVRYQ